MPGAHQRSAANIEPASGVPFQLVTGASTPEPRLAKMSVPSWAKRYEERVANKMVKNGFFIERAEPNPGTQDSVTGSRDCETESSAKVAAGASS